MANCTLWDCPPLPLPAQTRRQPEYSEVYTMGLSFLAVPAQRKRQPEYSELYTVGLSFCCCTCTNKKTVPVQPIVHYGVVLFWLSLNKQRHSVSIANCTLRSCPLLAEPAQTDSASTGLPDTALCSVWCLLAQTGTSSENYEKG